MIYQNWVKQLVVVVIVVVATTIATPTLCHKWCLTFCSMKMKAGLSQPKNTSQLAMWASKIFALIVKVKLKQ